MVDLQEHSQSTQRKQSDGKVKSLMDRTPSYLKSKFLSVLGSSNDLINGITTKLDIAANLSSSSDTDDHDSNRNSSTNRTEVSLDENIIDFDSRKVKERRAHDEVSTGKYRHPNFIARSRIKEGTSKSKEWNMIEMQTETASMGNASSGKSKSSASEHTLAAASPKDELSDQQLTKDSNTASLAVCPSGTGPSISVSENDFHESSLSEASIELKQWNYTNSDNSIQSLKSIASIESQSEDDSLQFMRRFVDILFQNSAHLTLELKSEFGIKTRSENGRLWFARLVSVKRATSKRVTETTFYSLIQHFAIVLFECNESDDFTPAKILMNMCFTFYYEVEVPGCEAYREYLYTYLRHQPIWHAIRFWNAAYFDAVQCERNHRPIPETQATLVQASDSSGDDDDEDDDLSSGAQSVQKHLAKIPEINAEAIRDDQEFQRNICFGQLGTFTCNMHAFGLSKELCDEFLRKQCVISNLTKEQERMLYDNINRMYKETAKWRAN